MIASIRFRREDARLINPLLLTLEDVAMAAPPVYRRECFKIVAAMFAFSEVLWLVVWTHGGFPQPNNPNDTLGQIVSYVFFGGGCFVLPVCAVALLASTEGPSAALLLRLFSASTIAASGALTALSIFGLCAGEEPSVYMLISVVVFALAVMCVFMTARPSDSEPEADAETMAA